LIPDEILIPEGSDVIKTPIIIGTLIALKLLLPLFPPILDLINNNKISATTSPSTVPKNVTVERIVQVSYVTLSIIMYDPC